MYKYTCDKFTDCQFPYLVTWFTSLFFTEISIQSVLHYIWFCLISSFVCAKWLSPFSMYLSIHYNYEYIYRCSNFIINIPTNRETFDQRLPLIMLSLYKMGHNIFLLIYFHSKIQFLPFLHANDHYECSLLSYLVTFQTGEKVNAIYFSRTMNMLLN